MIRSPEAQGGRPLRNLRECTARPRIIRNCPNTPRGTQQWLSCLLSKIDLTAGPFLCRWFCCPLKKYLSVRSQELFGPEHGNWPSSPQNESELSPKIYIRSCFPLLQGRSCRKSPWALFRSNCVKYDFEVQFVHRIEKIVRDRSCFYPNVFFDPMANYIPRSRMWPSWIEKVLTVISCNWAPGVAGSMSG